MIYTYPVIFRGRKFVRINFGSRCWVKRQAAYILPVCLMKPYELEIISDCYILDLKAYS